MLAKIDTVIVCHNIVSYRNCVTLVPINLETLAACHSHLLTINIFIDDSYLLCTRGWLCVFLGLSLLRACLSMR